MDPTTYQKLAQHTQCDQHKSFTKYIENNIKNNLIQHQLNHAIQGLQGEVGELATTLERHIYYGQELDTNNLVEEAGDCLWYLAELCTALEIDLGCVMESNIQKLEHRYPKKFEQARALEENRDREKERAVIEKNTRPEDCACTFNHIPQNVQVSVAPVPSDYVCREQMLHLKQEREEAHQELEMKAAKQRQAANDCAACDTGGSMGNGEKTKDGYLSQGEARRISTIGKYICGRCGGTVSDESVRRFLVGELSSLGCPDCNMDLAFEDMKCLK